MYIEMHTGGILKRCFLGWCFVRDSQNVYQSTSFQFYNSRPWPVRLELKAAGPKIQSPGTVLGMVDIGSKCAVLYNRGTRQDGENTPFHSTCHT